MGTCWPELVLFQNLVVRPDSEQVQFRHKHHAVWRSGTVKYASATYYIIVEDGQSLEQHYLAASLDVRAAPTPEQIAAAEREAAIFKMWEIACTLNDADVPVQRAVCEALYDAGYRLPEVN